MSSEEKNMINLNNYEEFLVLYVDDELSPSEKIMVEDFLAAHPDLKAELNILLSTKLPTEDIRFFGKENLYAERMKSEMDDEQLLLYIDNELNADDENWVENQRGSSPEFEKELQLLLRTKLDPADHIVYPNKKELYRSSGRTISLPLIISIAALLILILSATFLLTEQRPEAPGAVVAETTPKTDPLLQKKNIITPAQQTAVPSAKQPAVAVAEPTATSSARRGEVVENKMTLVAEVSKKELSIDPMELAGNETLVAVNIPANTHIENLPVTTQSPQSYNNTEVVSQVVAESETSNTKSKGSFKGFLRKATRMIERNTGIAAANADNEILIGAVAIKLK